VTPVAPLSQQVPVILYFRCCVLWNWQHYALLMLISCWILICLVTHLLNLYFFYWGGVMTYGQLSVLIFQLTIKICWLKIWVHLSLNAKVFQIPMDSLVAISSCGLWLCWSTKKVLFLSSKLYVGKSRKHQMIDLSPLAEHPQCFECVPFCGCFWRF
jgi:hypothetical protein